MNRFRRLSFQKKKETEIETCNKNAKSETLSTSKPIKKKLGHSIKKKFFTSKSNQRSFSLDESNINTNKPKSKAIATRKSCVELDSNLNENSKLDHSDVFEANERNHSNHSDICHGNVENDDRGKALDCYHSNGLDDHHSNGTGDYFHVANDNKGCNSESWDSASNFSSDISNHDDDVMSADVIYENSNVVQRPNSSVQQNNNNNDSIKNNTDVAVETNGANATCSNLVTSCGPTSPLLPPGVPINRPPCIHPNLSNEFKRLAQQGWYWGPLTRCEAEEKLNLTSDGSFLVRDSSDDRYLLSLSFRSNDRTLHTRIEHSAGTFSFYENNNTPTYSSVVDLIKDSVRDSQVGGVFCYSRPRDPLDRTYPVRLTHPVSRLAQVRSLKYICRFLIRQYTRIDHVENLPLPNLVKGYLNLPYF